MEQTPRTGGWAVPAAALAAVLATGLAACGGGTSGGTPQTSPQSSGSAAGDGPVGAGGNPASRPVASGEIAQISGRTLQVQSTTDQTAVTYSAQTRFTTEKRTTLASVKVGACIVATAPGSSSGTSHASITATSVRISQPTSSGCAPRAVGPGGPSDEHPSGFPSGALPSGASPSGVFKHGSLPSGAPGGKATPGALVAGTVTGVHGSTITVRSATPSGTSSTNTVRVTAATRYVTTVPTTHAALKVGLCAVVNGSTNSSGAVSATRIALSPKTNGSCTYLIRSGPNG